MTSDLSACRGGLPRLDKRAIGTASLCAWPGTVKPLMLQDHAALHSRLQALPQPLQRTGRLLEHMAR